MTGYQPPHNYTGETPPKYQIGEHVFLRGVRGIDPDPYTIYKVLDGGQYQLMKDGTRFHAVYLAENLISSGEFTTYNNSYGEGIHRRDTYDGRERREGGSSKKLFGGAKEQKVHYQRHNSPLRSDEKVVVGSSAQPSKVEGPIKIEEPTNWEGAKWEDSFDEFSAFLNLIDFKKNGDINNSKPRVGRTATGIIADEQIQNTAIHTGELRELDDAGAFITKSSEAEVGPKNVHLNEVRQHRPKGTKRWDFKTILSVLGLGERPLAKGKTRIRWRCGCGRKMYDDFTELRSGAAVELERSLNASMRTHAVSDASHSSRNVTSVSTPSPSADNSGYQQTAESDISLQRLAPRANARVGLYGNAATALDVHLEKCWLLVCGKSRRGPDSLLTQLNLSHTPSDKSLFVEMKEVYSNMRNTWGVQPFLRGVKTIRFVQFELHKMARVDIRKVPDMPPETRRDEYLYESCDVIPPVGENLMTHWFQHPEEAWDILYAYSRFPKKRKGELEVNPSYGPRVGWGIQIVEGWIGSRVWLLSLSLFLCGSLAFAICWTVLKHDIEGAFGVSAYVVALLTLVVGAAQANLG